MQYLNRIYSTKLKVKSVPFPLVHAVSCFSLPPNPRNTQDKTCKAVLEPLVQENIVIILAAIHSSPFFLNLDRASKYTA